MNATDYLSKIDASVQVRLIRAIKSLLQAGRSTVQVAEALQPQASFGKYDGCTGVAILSIACQTCREINAEIRRQDRAMMADLRESAMDISHIFRNVKI